jgi:arginase
MQKFSILDAPSILGLKPSGVENLPQALKKAGLIQGLQAEYAGQIKATEYNPVRDDATLLLNPISIREFSRNLAEKIIEVHAKNMFPVVLGGDCSILIGCMLALRKKGKYGLFFIDGHADFYQPEAEPAGEVASMELAIVSGRGPKVLTDIDGLMPLVKEENTVAFGYRDIKEQQKYKSQDIKKTAINCYELEKARSMGILSAAQQAIEMLKNTGSEGFWIHLDADVLDGKIMPAVDYQMPDGLQWDELSSLLKALMATKLAVGLTVTIFNPKLDPDGSIAQSFTKSIIAGLT